MAVKQIKPKMGKTSTKSTKGFKSKKPTKFTSSVKRGTFTNQISESGWSGRQKLRAYRQQMKTTRALSKAGEIRSAGLAASEVTTPYAATFATGRAYSSNDSNNVVSKNNALINGGASEDKNATDETYYQDGWK